MTTSADVVNRALVLINSQAFITSLTDGSVAATVANVIYAQTWQMVARQTQPDFALRAAPLTLSGQAANFNFQVEYLYPADCLRLRQVYPGAWNAMDPQPIRAMVGFHVVGSPIKVIWSNQTNAQAAYTSSTITEDQWDTTFAEAVARQLANPLAMGLAGRPDFARELLEEAMRYEQMLESVDDSGTRGAL